MSLIIEAIRELFFSGKKDSSTEDASSTNHYTIVGNHFLKNDSEVRIGSQNMLRLAWYANNHGFIVNGFSLGDDYLIPLDEDENQRVSSSLVEIMNKYGESETEHAMRDEFYGYYVIGVNLSHQEKNVQGLILRQGVIESSSPEAFQDLLTDAFEELRLS